MSGRNRRIARRRRPPAGRPTTSARRRGGWTPRGLQFQASRSAAAKPAAPPANASPTDNPAWLDLQRQLADLQQRRTRLLADRTPIHPEVQETEIRLADVQRQLEATARFVPPPARAVGPSSPAPQAVAAESINKLSEAVERASQANWDAAQARRQAENIRRQDLQIELEFAQAEPSSPSQAARLRMIAAAIVAGLTTTIGLGMIVVGAAMDTTVNSLADVRALLTVPIVGVIPRSRRSVEKRLGRTGFLRAMWIGAGVIVIAGCLGIMLFSGK